MQADALRFTWRERGGSQVRAPASRGFGSRLLELALAVDFGGTACLDWASPGVIWRLEAPLSDAA